tara:strand:+ start:113 stop:1024 length:912 start_codon:yes stop_codon:yes gene_type:complete
MDKELGHKLIDRLYNSGNLSLIECGDKRDELNKLKKDQIDDFVNGLPNSKHFLSELNRSKKPTEFKGVLERKWMQDKKGEKVPKSNFGNGYNSALSILVPILLFILFFYCALGISYQYHKEIYFSDWVNNYYNWKAQVSAFDWGIMPIWAVYIYIVIYVEKIFYKKREVIKYFKKPIDKKLFYISIVLTVVATIIFFLSVRVQLFSRVGRSTKEGFMFYLFFLTYTLPAILWVLYYLVLKESNIIYWLPKIYLKRKKEKTQVLKKAEAVKQLKEAKELLDLGILSQTEYDEKAKKLKPIILDN